MKQWTVRQWTVRQWAAVAFLAASGAGASAPAGAQTPPAGPAEINFTVRTTGDLLRLCEAQPTDPAGIAGLHFCHGFAVGAYQYHLIATAAAGKPQLVCPPNPLPSRNEAVAAFVAWAKQNPQELTTPPVEGLFRYLAWRYPCRT